MTVSNLKPLKRQSCDRCHTQKLRCARHGNSHGDMCIRCVRQGTECVYSAPLPKGRRPSSQVNRLGKGTALGKGWTTGGTDRKKGSGCDAGVNAGTQSHTVAQVSTKNINPNTTDLDAKDTEKINTITDTKDFGLDNYSKTRKEYEHDYEHGFTGLATPSTSTWEEHDFSTEFSPSPEVDHEMGGNETWPWESDHYWPDWVGADASMMNNRDLLPSSGRSLPVLTPLRTGPANTPEACVEISADCGERQSALSSTISSYATSIPNPNQIMHLNNHEDINHGLETPSASPCSQSGSFAADTQSCMAQLSELLSQLSATFITTQQDISQLHGSNSTFLNTAFESAASILSPNDDQNSSTSIPTRNSVLDTFIASQRLLEILQQLQNIQNSSTPTSPENTTSQHPFAPHPLDTLPISSLSKLVCSSSQQAPSQSVHHSVLHHLILACHSLLLNMYNPFVTTLQNSIQINGCSQSNTSWATRSVNMDVKMVMLVQLVSFLLERLGSGVGAYLGTGSGSGMEVEEEIQRKMVQLKVMLRI